MKKAIKILIGVVIVFVVLIAGIGITAMFMVDRLAKTTIERRGTYALGVETTVDSVDVQLMKQAFAMEGLNVSSPEGFGSAFLKLGSAGVTLDNVNGKVIELPTLSLRDIDVNLLKNDEGSNYGMILDNLKKFESDEGAGTPPPGGEDEGWKFVIKTVDIQNVKVHMELTSIGGDLTALDVDLDKIELRDLGTAGKPIGAGDLIGIIVKSVLSAAVNKAGDLGGRMGALVGDLSNGLGGLSSLGDQGVTVMMDVGGQLTDVTGEIAGELGQNLQKAAEEAAENVGKRVEEVTKGLGDVIKNPFGKTDDKKKGDGG